MIKKIVRLLWILAAFTAAPLAFGQIGNALWGRSLVLQSGSTITTLTQPLWASTITSATHGQAAYAWSNSAAAGSAGQVWTGAKTWSQATYPLTATGTGKMLQANGTNWVASTRTWPDTAAKYTIPYASNTNVMDAITTAASALMVSSSAGLPSMATDIPTSATHGGAYVYRAGGRAVPIADGGTGYGYKAGAFNALSPMSAVGDLIVGGTSGRAARLATGATGAYLAGGTSPAWAALNQAAVAGLTTADSPTFKDITMGSNSGATEARTLKIYSNNTAYYASLVCSGAYGAMNFSTNGGSLSVNAASYLWLTSSYSNDMIFDAGGSFWWRDRDASNVGRASLDSSNGNFCLQGSIGLYATPGTVADGDWQIVKSGADLLIQKRVSGAWVTKSTISGS